jgi:hypothetical protein
MNYLNIGGQSLYDLSLTKRVPEHTKNYCIDMVKSLVSLYFI